MSDPMAEIRASFFVECEELLEALHDGLQAIDDGMFDDEIVNMVFRAVHSIKGGAGAFGLDTLVAFAHGFESALDAVRAGGLAPEGEALKLFFHAADILGDLVRDCQGGGTPAQEIFASELAELDGLVRGAGGTDTGAAEDLVAFEPTPLALDLGFGADDLGDDSATAAAPQDIGQPGDEAVAAPCYRIHFRPDPVLYANGSEPLFLFRALHDLGPLEVACRDEDLPGLDALETEHSHIGWDLTLRSSEPATAIHEVFEFVEGLCALDIVAPSPRTDASAPGSGLIEVPSGAAPGRPAPRLDPRLDPLLDLASLSGATDAAQAFGAQASGAQAFRAPPDGDPPAPAATPARAAITDTPAGGGESPMACKPVTPTRVPATAPHATVRVDLDRIDRLVNLVGEIVINQAMLTQSVEAAGLASNSPVRAGLEEYHQLTRDIQESVMMIRAQPVKPLFQRMSRIVREAAAGLGKDVRLKTDGEHTEVDKTVIERLADPLTHMVRNAVDHGVELGRVRAAAGKPGFGTVTLTAEHRSGRIVIEVGDDGAGIDRAKVLNRAVETGLVPADAQLTDAEIDNLLFLPGLTTTAAVSNLSGRGVGMDVVRSAIQALGGRISISSEPGRGSRFSISLPLTLAVLDGMVVEVAGETLIAPLAAILETLALTDADIRALGPHTHVVNIRDRVVPLLDLGAELGYRDPLDSYSGGIVLLIGQEDGPAAAIAVDAIEDQRQVVIKGLQTNYGPVPGIAAATILGNGRIALILDPVDLVAKARGLTRQPGAAAARAIRPDQSRGLPA